MADNAYTHPVSQLLTLGECSPSRWLDYRALGLGPGDVPELIRMALDPGLNQASTESEAVWAPTHAWWALGQLEAAEAAEPLLELLDELDQDDWALEEIPEVMGLIGPAAIPALRGFLAQQTGGSSPGSAQPTPSKRSGHDTAPRETCAWPP